MLSFAVFLFTLSSHGQAVRRAGVEALGPALEIVSLGVHVQSASRQIAGRVFVMVAEERQRSDLNGDGDLSDVVVHAADLSGGQAIDLGFAGSIQFGDVPFFTALGHVLMRVDEASQGGTDLNGDGDALDQVDHLVSLSTLRVTNLGTIALRGLAVEDGQALLGVFESVEGRDLNADGDTLDQLVFALDLGTGVRSLLGQGIVVALRDGQALISEQEWSAGVDQNGDGDLLDEFFRAQDIVSGASERLKIVSSRNGSWRIVGHTLFSNPKESDLDLNGDGDLEDVVLHVYVPRAGRAWSSGLATGALRDFKGDEYWKYWPGAGGVLFPVSEAGEGVDLDGNGSVGGDVLHVIVVRSGVRTSISNLGLRVSVASGVRVLERWIGLPLTEIETGRDLDGDGHVLNVRVPLFHHIASSTTFNVGARGEILAMDDEHALISLLQGQVLRLHRVDLVGG